MYTKHTYSARRLWANYRWHIDLISLYLQILTLFHAHKSALYCSHQPSGKSTHECSPCLRGVAPRYRLGSALSALGRLAEAQEAYEEAQRQRPEDSDVTWCEIYERNNGLLSIVFDEYIMRIYIYIYVTPVTLSVCWGLSDGVDLGILESCSKTRFGWVGLGEQPSESLIHQTWDVHKILTVCVKEWTNFFRRFGSRFNDTDMNPGMNQLMLHFIIKSNMCFQTGGETWRNYESIRNNSTLNDGAFG